MSFKFPVVKLIDYKERWAEQSGNIFAMVVRTHLKGLETRKTPEQRFHWKKELITSRKKCALLCEKVITKQKFFEILDNHLSFGKIVG
ncbi:MAG: hypothetical protein ABFS56_24130 [Pseudomonadota bacterium]